MCEGRFPGRKALRWAPSWILLLPFGLIEGCSNWQSFTIRQHWWRFWRISFLLLLFFPPLLLCFSPKGLILKLLVCCLVCVWVGIVVCIGPYVCGFMHTRRHPQGHTRARLNASAGNCLNGIREDYGSCWREQDCGIDMGKHTHVAFIAPVAMLLVDSQKRWYVVTWCLQNRPQGCKYSQIFPNIQAWLNLNHQKFKQIQL